MLYPKKEEGNVAIVFTQDNRTHFNEMTSFSLGFHKHSEKSSNIFFKKIFYENLKFHLFIFFLFIYLFHLHILI